MPTYDYACSDCGHRFEKFHSMTAEPLRQCPECKNDSLERLIGPGAGIIFKGSGFYETDYRTSSYKSGQEAEKKAAEPAKKASEKGGESTKADTGSSGGDSTSTGSSTPTSTPASD